MRLHVRGKAAALTAAAVVLLGVACGGSADPTPEPAPPTATPAPTAAPTPDARSDDGEFRWDGVPAGTDAAPPASAPSLPGGAIGFSHYVFEQVGDNVVTTLVEGPRSRQIRVPASYLQLREWAETGAAEVELNMSDDELFKLVAQLDAVRAATERFRDVDAARAAGYRQATEEVPNMGAHFVHPLWSLDGKFDPARPEILLYVQDDAGEWELVGTSFVQSLLTTGFDHPETFVGPLDNWHVHYDLCTGPTFQSRSATEAECRKDGGVWVPAYGWMIHAWVWVDNPLGVFTMWNPNIPPVADPDAIREAVDVGGDATVNIENFGFGNATISAGETLAWSNADGVPHTVTAGSGGRSDGGFDSGVMDPGASFEVKFDQPGRFAYTCTLHAFMSGVVVVNP